MPEDTLESLVSTEESENGLSRRQFVEGVATAAIATVAFSGETHAQELTQRTIHDKQALRGYLQRVVPVQYPHADAPKIDSDYQAWKTADGQRRELGPHKGIDMVATPGTPIIAAAPGWARVSSNSNAGIGVEIEHETKLYLQPRKEAGKASIAVPLLMLTIYSHLSESYVEEHYSHGKHKWIKRGEVVGEVGQSGRWAGNVPHLHFGVYTGGPYPVWEKWEHVNPHLLWADGPGKITCYEPGKQYDERNLILTFPLQCKTHTTPQITQTKG